MRYKDAQGQVLDPNSDMPHDGSIATDEEVSINQLIISKKLKLQELEKAFNIASNLPITVGTTTYNGGKDSASSIMGGIELSNLNLETSIEIWDINNNIAVYSIADAMHIVKTIALDYRVKILAKQAKVTQVNAIIVDPLGQYPTYESAIVALNLI